MTYLDLNDFKRCGSRTRKIEVIVRRKAAVENRVSRVNADFGRFTRYKEFESNEVESYLRCGRVLFSVVYPIPTKTATKFTSP